MFHTLALPASSPPMDFWGILTPDPHYIQSPAKLQVHSSHLLNPLGLTATAGETQAH